MSRGRRLAWSPLVVAALLLPLSGPAAAQEQAGSAQAPVMSNRFGPSGGGAAPAAPAEPAAPGIPAAPAAPAARQPAATNVILLSPITPVGRGVRVHDKTLEQCQLQKILPRRVAARHPSVALSDAVGTRKLELTIIDVHAPSGGFFSGPKWITVEGRLLEGRTVLGTFVAKEKSMAAADACGMLDKVMSVLADDIAAWLHHPKKGSKLGSAR